MRRTLIAALLATSVLACTRDTSSAEAASTASAAAVSPADSGVRLVVHKDPNCGCCTAWAEHMRRNGFSVTPHDTDALDSVKTKLGVPAGLQACHTSEVGGYIVEGHVPADLVKRLLAEKPRIAGLAVAGMPAGSPGMESSVSESYEIIAFDSAGGRSVYARR